MQRDEMFIVWCPTSKSPPSYQHKSFDSARNEAKRLSALNPHREFIVMRAMVSIKTQEPFQIEPYAQDDIPF